MNKKIAVARLITTNVYDVTYPGHRHGDSNVTYDYLKVLQSQGYEVRVGGFAYTAPHTLVPPAQPKEEPNVR